MLLDPLGTPGLSPCRRFLIEVAVCLCTIVGADAQRDHRSMLGVFRSLIFF